MKRFNWTLLAAFFILAKTGITAGELTVKTAEVPPPETLSEAIRALLDPKAVQLLQDGKPWLEIWFRKDVPLKSEAGKLDSLAETTLIGAVAVRGKGLRDYKDNDVMKGVFTARYILQPQDGDHLGTAEFDYFLALVAADADKELDGLNKFKPLTKASGKLTPSGHPAILSMRPVSGEAVTAPALTEPASEHKAIWLNLSAKGPGGEKVQVPFELVFEGHGHIQ